MQKNIIIVGYGQRGKIYGDYALQNPDKFKVVAIVDNNPVRLEFAKSKIDCPVYSDYQEMLSARLKADIVAISTQDKDHKEHAVACMQAGYDLLLEKPIANSLQDCIDIYEAAKKYERKVIVCHVLRYSPFYSKIKDIIDDGTLGNIVTIHASENVGFYHQAHSFVRGPWHSTQESSPMILAKCCHDMDIFRWLIGKKCLAVSSFGSLTHFKKQNAPIGSAEYCSECACTDCLYKAQDLYTDFEKCNFRGYFTTSEDKEQILKDLQKTPYDKCVYRCDNDVVDHQVSILRFDEEITVTHTMTAFSKDIYRDIKIHGTKAELVGVMEDNYIEIRPYKGEKKVITWKSDFTVGGHSGADQAMMTDIWKTLNGEQVKSVTYIDVSVESHLMAFAAEESRVNNGSVKEISVE